MLAPPSSKRHYSADSATGSATTSDSNNLYPTDFSTLAITSPAPNNAAEAFVQVGWSSSDAPTSLAESQPNPDYYYMPAVLPGNPPIRVYDPTPTSDSAHFTSQNQFYGSELQEHLSWSFPDDSNNNRGFPDSHQPFTLRPSLHQHLRQVAHQRHSSASTIASAGPSSPYTPASSSPRIVDNESIYCPSPGTDPNEYGHYLTYPYQKNVARPSQLGFQHQLYVPAYQDHSTLAPHDERIQQLPHVAMAPRTMSQPATETSGPARLASKSSNGGDDAEETAKALKESRSIIPKFDRTMSDIYQDELYNPDAPTSAPSSQTRSNQPALLSPYSGVFSERLQAANDMRSSSPAQPISRNSSPFRQGSEYLNVNGEQPAPRLSSAAQIREQQKAEADKTELLRAHQRQSKVSKLDAPSTISPKEAMLDFKESDTDQEQSFAPIKREVLPNKAHDTQSGSRSFKPTNVKRLSPEGNALAGQGHTTSQRRQSSSDYSQASSAQSRTAYAPSSAPIPQQYPFIPQLPAHSSSTTAISSRDPEFPATLMSMESTRSDTPSRSQSGRNDSVSDVQKRPPHTTADTGTYTCPNNGCSARFTTAQKLQKHRRESHRQSTPQSASTTANGGNSPIESAQLSSASGSSTTLNRNSQAGPHQCRQINPTTGKPCNSIFSRPYDLTRHEDTIHNDRKQKVRCHLCTEEKTFSRNDALTRHMRVVHPEVDFPGKNRRRGGK